MQVRSSTLNLPIYREKKTKIIDSNTLVHSEWKLHVTICSYLLVLCARGGLTWVIADSVGLSTYTHTHTSAPPPWTHMAECHRFLWSNWSWLKIKVQRCTVSLSVFNDCRAYVGRSQCLSCTHFCILLIVAFLLIRSGLINQGLIDPIMKSMMWNRLLWVCVCMCVYVNTHTLRFRPAINLTTNFMCAFNFNKREKIQHCTFESPPTTLPTSNLLWVH